jgi:C-terminal processing protease CtpA/Prc
MIHCARKFLQYSTNYSFNRAFGQHHQTTDDKSVVSAQSNGGGAMVFVDDDMYEESHDALHQYQQQQHRQQRNDRQYHHHQQQQRQNQYEPEIFVIEAPPGWLGVVIDTPAGMGPPVVYEIMEASPIVDQIRLGDQLLSVDDIDVQDMSATEVSRIISQRANNPVRTFCVMRIPSHREPQDNFRNLIV